MQHPSGPACKRRQDSRNLGPGVRKTKVGFNKEMGVATLFHIRHLLGQDGIEFGLAHARPPQHAGALGLGWCGHDEHRIAAHGAARLQQQRDIEPPL
jgi:hypothetical protein